MVKFIPPYIGEEVKSNAEKQMYEILQELNLEDAYVLHSLGLPRHEDKKYGEVDFVIVCKRGIACLEIKGGRVECHEGKWLFTDRYGIQRKKTEGPLHKSQAICTVLCRLSEKGLKMIITSHTSIWPVVSVFQIFISTHIQKK